MTRRALLAALLAGVVVGNARAITPDRPDVVLIAAEETGYDQTVALARMLAGATGLRVKSVFPAPLADAEVNDMGQVVAEKLLARMAPVAERLQARQDAPGALVIVLVARDMNGADGRPILFLPRAMPRSRSAFFRSRGCGLVCAAATGCSKRAPAR